jgi:lysozyme
MSDEDVLLLLGLVCGAAALIGFAGLASVGAPAASSSPNASPNVTPSPSPSPIGGTTMAPASSPASSPNGGFSPSPAQGGASAVNLSPRGAAFIKQQEGLTLTALPDAAGHEIGYGHTMAPGEPSTITLAQAESYFAADIAAVQQTIAGSVTVPLTQGQYDALASLIYNIGTGAFLGSTLLRKLNAGDYAGAAAQFPRWNLSGGRVVAALTVRRSAEQSLFEGAIA